MHVQKPAARRVIAIFLLALFVVNGMLSRVFFTVWDIRIKHEMAEAISRLNAEPRSNAELRSNAEPGLNAEPPSRLETTIIAVPLSDCKHADEDEIMFEGRLYDVVKRACRNNIVYFYVINDTEEEELISNFNAHMQDCFGSSSPYGHFSKPVKIVAADYLQHRLSCGSDRAVWGQAAVVIALMRQQSIQRVYYPVPTPPPRRVAALFALCRLV